LEDIKGSNKSYVPNATYTSFITLLNNLNLPVKMESYNH